ncbi:hypothetical protein [Prochlorothrix hollandica]|uniref:Uncharacterized protein n=1 Tax=Prochlorothrix hollandica PCC 9006 = CALU 1027 TaxID=317619 RepID=A0A0M2Q2H9_PROHO|nr:hypothetical protein [Prochlorothrix hollandica]KKJ01184.1 hypothetical protein PROH_02000 [Prochlorothrix hollandica PCC 9006 = CALU 1027]
MDGLDHSLDASRTLLDCITHNGGIFTFHLTESRLLGIFQQRDQGQTLSIPKTLRQTLQKAALWDLPLDPESDSDTRSESDQNNSQTNLPSPIAGSGSAPIARASVSTTPVLTLQSGLTFVTEYQGELVLESTIGLDGDVLYRVKRDLLRHEQALAVTAAHNWLVDQLMASLRSQMVVPEALTWVIVLIPTGLSLSMALAQGDIETLIVPLGTSALSPWLKDRLHLCLQQIAPRLRSWVLAQVMSPSPPVKWLADRVMDRFQ